MSKRRLVDRNPIRCQGVNQTDVARRTRCTNRATGYVKAPAKFYLCASCRRLWNHPTAWLGLENDMEILPA